MTQPLLIVVVNVCLVLVLLAADHLATVAGGGARLATMLRFATLVAALLLGLIVRWLM